MKYYIYLTIITLLFSVEAQSQTETCPQNLNHPDNRIISQVIGTDTILREYILKVPNNYDINKPNP